MKVPLEEFESILAKQIMTHIYSEQLFTYDAKGVTLLEFKEILTLKNNLLPLKAHNIQC